MRPSNRPPTWRAILGFALAPIVPSLVYAVVLSANASQADLGSSIWTGFVLVAVIGGYLPTLLFGPLAYLLLRNRLRPTLLNCALAGAALASLPWMLLLLFQTGDASVDGHVTVSNGNLTWFGLYEGAKIIGAAASLGGLGGATFWLIAAAGHRPQQSAEPATAA